MQVRNTYTHREFNFIHPITLSTPINNFCNSEKNVKYPLLIFLFHDFLYYVKSLIFTFTMALSDYFVENVIYFKIHKITNTDIVFTIQRTATE